MNIVFFHHSFVLFLSWPFNSGEVTIASAASILDEKSLNINHPG